MKQIFLSAAHGSAGSLVKSLLTNTKKLSVEGTCHDSWSIGITQNGDNIKFNHNIPANIGNPDTSVRIQVNPINVAFITMRIVYLDFIYATDPYWIKIDGAWTQQKHDRLAGSNWPAYSTNILDYPLFCRKEMCQVVQDRIMPWITNNDQFDYTINSNDIFGSTSIDSLQNVFTKLNCKLDLNFLQQWKNKNFELHNKYRELFE